MTTTQYFYTWSAFYLNFSDNKVNEEIKCSPRCIEIDSSSCAVFVQPLRKGCQLVVQYVSNKQFTLGHVLCMPSITLRTRKGQLAIAHKELVVGIYIW